MVLVQILLAVPKRLRRRGIIFYGIGFAIRFNIKQNFETKKVKLGVLEKIIIANSICIAIGSTIYFLFFTKSFFNVYYIPFGERIQQKIEEFIENASLLDVYLVAWLTALAIGLPHEYMHIYFSKMSHIRAKNMYIIAIMGFPLMFFVTIDHKNATPLQRAFVASGGLIFNAMALFAATILYLIFPDSTMLALAFYASLAITVINGTAIIIYLDGGRTIAETLRAINENYLLIYILILYILMIVYVFL